MGIETTTIVPSRRAGGRGGPCGAARRGVRLLGVLLAAGLGAGVVSGCGEEESAPRCGDGATFDGEVSAWSGRLRVDTALTAGQEITTSVSLDLEPTGVCDLDAVILETSFGLCGRTIAGAVSWDAEEQAWLGVAVEASSGTTTVDVRLEPEGTDRLNILIEITESTVTLCNDATISGTLFRD